MNKSVPKDLPRLAASWFVLGKLQQSPNLSNTEVLGMPGCRACPGLSG
jgi:hypothetical protein